MAGHALSSFMLRQMEYDADRYETRQAGSAVLEETSRRLLLLGLAADAAHNLVAASWSRSGRLPDNLSALVTAVAGSVPADKLLQIERRAEEARTGFFDTHPAPAERLASARREATPGVFHLGGPASLLFKDFAGLSRAVTLDFYRGVIGKGASRAALVPAASLLNGE